MEYSKKNMIDTTNAVREKKVETIPYIPRFRWIKLKSDPVPENCIIGDDGGIWV